MKNKPTIITDRAIPGVFELFNDNAFVIALDSKEITADALKHADALFVRTVTKVNKTLLENSGIKFVGSMTAGFDHLDIPWLSKNQIEWAYAPGANATTVAEYVIACIAALQTADLLTTQNPTIGIIGVGHVGRALCNLLPCITTNILTNDPPRSNLEANFNTTPLSRLKQADLISLHVPFTTEGKYSTRHFIDQPFLHSLKQNCTLINTCRGEVIDTRTLLKSKALTLCLDVFENEPSLDIDLLNHSFIATPHIAGYSIEAKLRATQMVYARFCEFFGWRFEKILRPSTHKNLSLKKATSWQEIVLTSYNPLTDTAILKNNPSQFASLRNHYNLRNEFSTFKVDAQLSCKDQRIIKALGFDLGPVIS